MYLKIKRLLDITASILLLAILFPLFIICYIIIKTDTKGPVIFSQKRAGKNGRPFTLYKFRTMSAKNTDVVTKSGRYLRRYSIDELPQLINILKGDMSFIGPRPLLISYLSLYDSTQVRRHEVLPGLSGLAQIKGRNTLSWEKKFEYDICYVNNICFMLDLKIAVDTIWRVICAHGVNTDDKTLMPPFEGTKKA